jgi:hypothetical protein
MGQRVTYSVPELFRLWANSDLTRAEVARLLGVTAGQLTKLASRHGLGPRGRQHRAFSMDDPTPEQIAERAAQCREKHMAMRRTEDVTSTHSKVSKWRRGVCQPKGVKA